MKITRLVTTAVLAGLLGACASTPKTTMLVPSRQTAPQLERLSRQSEAVVDVLTVDREQRLLRLQSSSGPFLQGVDLGAAVPGGETGPIVRIPFDELALVYASAGAYPSGSSYPALPGTGTQEQRLSCDELAVDFRRTGAIRWYARLQDALPFTAHEAAMQHGKNAAKDVGMAALVVLAIGGCAAGGCGGWGSSAPSTPSPISLQAYRWAVTAADHREVGLLQLRRDKGCAVQPAHGEGDTDLAILSRIEESQKALIAKRLADTEQRDQQTRWLDEFDPPHKDAAVVTKERAQKVVLAGEGEVLAAYEEAYWYPNPPNDSYLKADPLKQSGAVVITKTTVTFLKGGFPADASAAHSAAGAVNIRYSDVSSVRILGASSYWFWGMCAIAIAQSSGRVDWIALPSKKYPGLMDRAATLATGELLQKAVREAKH